MLKNNIVIKSSIVYIICSLLSKGLSIITVPVFTRILSTNEMGIVNLFSSWQGLIVSFATLSLTSGGYMLALKEFSNNRNAYMSSMLTLTSIIAGVLFIIYFLAPAFWQEFLGLSSPLCILLLSTFLFMPAIDFWLLRQRFEYKYLHAGLVMIIPSVMATIISVTAVIIFSKNGGTNLGEIRLISSYAVLLLVAFAIYITILLKGHVFFNKIYWRYSLKLSIPLVGNSVAMQVLSVSDRIMISKLVDNSALGIYGILYAVSSLSLIVWSAINSSYVPYLFQNIDKIEKEKSIRKSATGLLLLYAGVAFLLTLLAPEIVKILATGEYYEAIYIMPPIAAGIFFTSISNMYSNILIYCKKTQYIMISSSVAAILNIGLNYIFIQRYGYVAAAYTTLVAYVVLAIFQGGITVKNGRKRKDGTYRRVYDDKLLFFISFFVVVLCLSGLLLYQLTYVRYFLLIAMLVMGIKYREKILKVIER